jgi:hypothetical protein
MAGQGESRPVGEREGGEEPARPAVDGTADRSRGRPRNGPQDAPGGAVVNTFASQELSSLRRRIRKARKTRALFAGAILCEGFPLAVNLVEGPRFPALLFAFAAVMFTVNAALQTRLLRRLRREEARLAHECRPRPDYAAIAAMETEIWGHAFDHDGAPDHRPGGAS